MVSLTKHRCLFKTWLHGVLKMGPRIREGDGAGDVVGSCENVLRFVEYGVSGEDWPSFAGMAGRDAEQSGLA